MDEACPCLGLVELFQLNPSSDCPETHFSYNLSQKRPKNTQDFIADPLTAKPDMTMALVLEPLYVY